MFYLKDNVFGKYVKSIVPLKSGVRAIYFDSQPGTGARWVTRKGAESAREKLTRTGTNPPGVADCLAVVEID